ncbi:MAG: undecaprenyl-diphosphatase UppP [Candidatus Pacebacteria bacterium]|nr:undecaprenyl-diphosphatase UppP [Candidatus Paceibacterota bacterium]
MEILQAAFLGVIQGFTEFLPVSSTGHLILVRDVLGMNIPNGLTYDIFLHLATVLAVFLYFRKDIIRMAASAFRLITRPESVVPQEKTLITAIAIGTIPAAVLGFAFNSVIETSFRNPLLVATALILGSVLFGYAEKKSTEKESLSNKKGFVIGFYQALALIPGVSRSGSTISGGLITGLSREEAVRFSFLLSFPIITAAGLYKVIKFSDVLFATSAFVPSLVGFFVALVSGLCAIRFLIRFLKTHSLIPFIVYRIMLAALVIIVTLF